MTPTSDPWRVLGLRPGAPREDVARAWRSLAARHHPDAGGDPDRFRELVAAKDRLLTTRGDVSHAPVQVVRSSPASRLLRPLRRRIDRRINPRVS